MWVEARLNPGAVPEEVYRWAGTGAIDLYHHFWDEPWWPGAYVIRMEGVNRSDIEECPSISHLQLWDEGPDRRLYGNYLPWVFGFFQEGSVLSEVIRHDPAHQEKMVHCFLNAQGMSVLGEAWFALRFALRRVRMQFRIWTKRA
jgi:hypothetical protein